VKHGVSSEDIGKEIVESLGSEAKLVLECTGVESSIHAAIYVRIQFIANSNRF
jgi:L-iditol 2-dehydrogenase